MAHETESPMATQAPLNDGELLRYSRQIFLKQWDLDGQDRATDAHVLIVGAGGLGCPAALYLAGAGIGRLTLVDDDVVELSNLHRQIAYRESDVGLPKVEALKQQLQQLNHSVSIHAVPLRIDEAWLAEHLNDSVHMVLDCTDNFSIRSALNRVCQARGIPLVSGAAIRYQGQVALYDFTKAEQACAVCLYGDGEMPDTHCHEAGILGPVVGLMGTQQALLALQWLQGISRLNQVYVLDALRLSWRQLNFNQDKQCPVCANK